VPSRALEALDSSGVAYQVIRHGPVRSLAEAANARGVEPADVVKTMVVRRGEGDYLFVLVPGDRTISWPKLRALLGVSRLSMPDAALAREVTGYERGTITPLGSTTAWPVVTDERVLGRQITLGAGEHGVAVAVRAEEVLAALGATVADVTEPEDTYGRSGRRDGEAELSGRHDVIGLPPGAEGRGLDPALARRRAEPPDAVAGGIDVDAITARRDAHTESAR
jgi:Cys-tRNA(Pro)/Cys-tRNA(Cys) deacylase